MGVCGSIYKVSLRTFALYAAGLCMLLAGAVAFVPANANAQASPVTCAGPYNQYNRQDSCGFFNNQGLDSGPDLRGGTWNPDGTWTYASGSDPGVPNDVDTAQEFINMVLGDYYNGDQRARTSAEFIILSMIDVRPDQDQVLTKSVSTQQIIDWQSRVLSYADIDDNTDGTGTSTGTNGSITWSDYRGLSCGDMNTYYQIDYNDVAAYEVTVGNAPECVDGEALMSGYIVFADTDGNEILQIRRLCMNPTGDIGSLAEVQIEEDGALGDLVFEDKYKDGVYDPSDGDVGIPGVTVALYAANAACERGELIGETTTDESGRYQFTDLPVISAEGLFAKYVVAVTDDEGVLNGFASSAGQADEDDNSQNPAGYCMTLTLGERNNQTGDFGYYRVDGDEGGSGEEGQDELAPTGSTYTTLFVGAIIAIVCGGVVLQRFRTGNV